MHFTKAAPSLSQSRRMKNLSKEGKLNQEEMKSILGEIEKGEVRRVMFKNEQLYRFFPRDYSLKQIKQEILQESREQSQQALNAPEKKARHEKNCAQAVSPTPSQPENRPGAKEKQERSGTGSHEGVRGTGRTD